MDPARFDHLTRSLFATGTRRQALASTLAGLGSLLDVFEGNARRHRHGRNNKKKRKKDDKPKCKPLEEQCGQGCCEPITRPCCNGLCCDFEWTCCKNKLCCPKGFQCVGTNDKPKCCHPDDPDCCPASRRSGTRDAPVCCAPNETPCGDSCCSSDRYCCGTKCCPPAASVCDPGGGDDPPACCYPGTKPCHGTCCGDDAHTLCCDKSNGQTYCFSDAVGCPE